MAAGLTPPLIAGNLAGAASTDRRELRRVLLARRQAMSADEWARHSGSIRALLQAGFPQLSGMRLGFCWPFKREPDLRPLIECWTSAGHDGFRALLPVVIQENHPLAFRAWSPGTVMLADRHGIPAPASGEFLNPEAVLIPVLGFDAAGYRIGYGGGFFDRTLASLVPRPLAVGVGFELARLDSIHPEAHDQPLDAMVTEAGILRPAR